MKTLTLQAFYKHQWQDIATLDFDENTYELLAFNYINEHIIAYFNEKGDKAISVNCPVDFFVAQKKQQLLAIFNDIIPGGASRRYWLQALDLTSEPESFKLYTLLKKATIAPIGNLRIKEALPTQEEILLFPIEEVLNRHHHFLEYANQRGAMVGGATGAGGEAPKFLLRYKKAENKVWIDNQQTGNSPDDYYLVKYPRGNYSPIDCDILRTEYHYYQELTEMGFSTIEIARMSLKEGQNYPSLWLPRFDIVQNEKGEIQTRYAVESVYSMLQKQGGELDHYDVLKQLIQILSNTELEKPTPSELTLEWVKRDLLNIAFGNSDNHGRNTAFLRNEHKIMLAPIYDFAPMRADPAETILRSTRWNSTLEVGTEYHFLKIIESLNEWIDEQFLFDELQNLSTQLINLKSRLAKRGVPESILAHPALAFDYLPEKLQRWGLI